LEVTYNKTSNLVFPDAITSVDRGSTDILVQKAEGVENILRVKASTKGFEETNLSVITKDGKLYSFLVCFTIKPAYLNVTVGSIRSNNIANVSIEKASFPSSSLQKDATRMGNYAEKARLAGPNLHGLRNGNSKMTLRVNGFYVSEDVMFCRFHLQNGSAIDYEIDGLRFYIRDRKASKRTASQEWELVPLYLLGDTSLVRGQRSETLIAALPKFTIPNGKYLMVEVMERAGGRHLHLKVKRRHVLKAKNLDENR
jgi:conjugative transposon TraN protein